MQARETTVVTWESPKEARIDVCRACEREMKKAETWPKDSTGQEHCQVYMGEHKGVCDVCEVKG